MFSAAKSGAASSGYNLTNSLRFRASASANLTRTPASSGDRQKFTISVWIKRGTLSTEQAIITQGSGNRDIVRINPDNTLFFYWFDTANYYAVSTTQVFRDPSAWYHIVVAVDTTQATASNRIKLYVNGTQITALTSTSYPSQNYNFTYWNTTNASAIGKDIVANNAHLDGYMAEFHFIDGLQKAASDFGSTNATTGVWQPAKYTGTYGTNGFYLNFSDIGQTVSSNVGLGKDFSGNTNYWVTNNIYTASSTNVNYDAMLDVPTLTSATVGNYCVMNPLGNAVGNAPATLSEANLTCKNTATSYLGALGTIGLPTSGKFYWEVQLTQNSGPSNLSVFGIAPSNIPLTGNQANYANSISWYLGNNTIIQLPSTGTITAVSGGSTTSDVFQICYDGSTGKVYLGRNNTFYNSAGSATGNPSSGTNETTTLTTGDLLAWFFAYQEGAYFNFGQRPFTYTPPSGFVRLNTYNLPDSTIKKGNSYMDATIYTGNGSSQTIVNAGQFKPDLVWIKTRSNTYSHNIEDSVRGTSKNLQSDSTAAEGTGNNGAVTAFNSNGFTIAAGGSSILEVGANAATYVGWQWQAGQGSTTTGTGTGGITSVTQSVNATAGFSIVTYTGSGSNGTVTHGLGVTPKWVIVKARSVAAENWQVYSSSLTSAAYRIRLNATDAQDSQPTMWNSTAPTSTVFSIGTASGVNTSAVTYVAYCWAEIAGFSKFGSYTGGGNTGASTPNANGPFIYLGFRPKFVLIKRTSSAADWVIYDSVRGTSNANYPWLYPNSSSAEVATETVDFLSNGFKIRSESGATMFPDGATFIYMAFAENPFKNSLAR